MTHQVWRMLIDKTYKIWAMDLSTDCFIQNTVWSDTLAFLTKEIGILPSEVYDLSIGRELTLPLENYHVCL